MGRFHWNRGCDLLTSFLSTLLIDSEFSSNKYKLNPIFIQTTSFLDALASLKTMFKIQSLRDVFQISRLKSIRKYQRALMSVTEYNRVLQSVAECCRVLQSVTECYRVFLAHLLGPIFGLVLGWLCLFFTRECENPAFLHFAVKISIFYG